MRNCHFALVIACLVPLLCGVDAVAATYYIDYAAGSNSNNGTSKTTPWKTHPYMQAAAACTGSGSTPHYTHSAGDTFIFKQGSSWPNACFDMKVTSGGNSSTPDQYTYDPTWGTAGGTTGNTGQAVGVYQFAAGGLVINGSDGYNKFIDVSANYVTINGVEFNGLRWTNNCQPYHNCFMLDIEASTNVILSNCYADGWTHPGATVDGAFVMVGATSSPWSAGSRITGCVIDGANSGGAGVADSGGATYSIPLADNNIVRNMSNGLLLNANAVVHDNLIGPINQSFDPTDHENCIEPIQMPAGTTTTNYFYNNVWHDCVAVGILTQGGAPTNGAEIDYLWNNVAYVGSISSPPIPFQFDTGSTNMAGSAIYAYNNTIYGGAGFCMRSSNRGNGDFGAIDLRNNHCISQAGLVNLQTSAKVLTNANNLLDSTATNYNSPPSGNPPPFAYSPSSSSANTVGYGQNLSGVATGILATLAYITTYGGYGPANSRGGSSCSPTPGTPGCWDAGAYLFGSGGPPAPTALHTAVH